jgi:hypothetical protein
MNGLFAVRAYQPFPCRVYPPAAAPLRGGFLDETAQPVRLKLRSQRSRRVAGTCTRDGPTWVGVTAPAQLLVFVVKPISKTQPPSRTDPVRSAPLPRFPITC